MVASPGAQTIHYRVAGQWGEWAPTMTIHQIISQKRSAAHAGQPVHAAARSIHGAAFLNSFTDHFNDKQNITLLGGTLLSPYLKRVSII